MPVHRVPIDDNLEKKVQTIEVSERVVSSERHGDVLLVFTEQRANRRAGGRETR